MCFDVDYFGSATNPRSTPSFWSHPVPTIAPASLIAEGSVGPSDGDLRPRKRVSNKGLAAKVSR